MGARPTPNLGRSILPRLSRDLRRRLSELEAERNAIRRALAVIEGRDGSRSRRVSTAGVLEAVRAEPGIRATMLALQLGVPPQEVAAHLEKLRAEGAVSRTRLGWRARPAATPSRTGKARKF